MSGIVNKVKDALSSDKSHDTTTGTSGHSTTAAPGASTHTGTGVTGTAPAGTTTDAGTTHLGSGTTTTGSTTAGPYSSNLANKADPRVDSDLDHSRNAGLNKTTGGYDGATGHTGTTTSGIGGTTTGMTTGTHTGQHQGHHGHQGHGAQHTLAPAGTTAATSGTMGSGSTNVGPHNTSTANKLDPRVDSDLDASRTMGGNRTTAGTTTGTGLTSGTTTGSGLTGGTTTGSGLTGGTTTGSGLTGGTTTGSGLTGGNTTGTTTGATHTSGLGSGSNTTSGMSGTTAGTSATSEAPGANVSSTGKTVGPHKSDLMNKLDPRVDSDLDGSKTVGGNKTTHANEPLDASKHRPSVFQEAQGDPSIEHDNPQHSTIGRHGASQGSGTDAYGSGIH